MNVKFRNQCNIENFGEDYYRIRNFLLQREDSNFSYGRWDWMVTHSYLDTDALKNIAVWEIKDKIAGLATFDTSPGAAYFVIEKEFDYLKKEMLLYANEFLGSKDGFKANIRDDDYQFQEIASKEGFIPTTDREHNAWFPITPENTEYTLPEGFHITSMADDYNPYQYGLVLWKGFNHELNGETREPFSEKHRRMVDQEMKRPNVNLNLKIAVVNSEGEFVSYCGMWQDEDSEIAIVEPVATVPEYRKKGLGKAAVLEGIKRCGKLGSKVAQVGSSQQFYYNIGFRPLDSSTFWKRKS